MKFRKALLILSLVATSLATSCTTRYQDMLKDRDDQIRSLNGDLARMRGEGEELQNRLNAVPRPVNATTARTEPSSLLNDLQRDLGSDADVSGDCAAKSPRPFGPRGFDTPSEDGGAASRA